jgi:uncharacterized protein
MRSHDLVALGALYARAERLLEGWSCEGSTECCRFGVTGREPQLWPNEWALVERALARRGQGRPRARLPIASPDGACPLLDGTGQCTVYAERPFGCRSFYCTRATGPARRPPRADLQEIAREIATLAEKVEPTSRPRALTSWLRERRS